MLINTVIHWSPSSAPEHEAAYCEVFRQWYPEHEIMPHEMAAQRRYVQEQVEAKAERDGHDFLLVQATPRFVRAKLAEFGWEFTQENVHKYLRMLAELPGFDRNHVYDIDA